MSLFSADTKSSSLAPSVLRPALLLMARRTIEMTLDPSVPKGEGPDIYTSNVTSSLLITGTIVVDVLDL